MEPSEMRGGPVTWHQPRISLDGKLDVLRLTADDGQAWEFRRE
jgi:hypothetical protein